MRWAVGVSALTILASPALSLEVARSAMFCDIANSTIQGKPLRRVSLSSANDALAATYVGRGPGSDGPKAVLSVSCMPGNASVMIGFDGIVSPENPVTAISVNDAISLKASRHLHDWVDVWAKEPDEMAKVYGLLRVLATSGSRIRLDFTRSHGRTQGVVVRHAPWATALQSRPQSYRGDCATAFANLRDWCERQNP